MSDTDLLLDLRPYLSRQIQRFARAERSIGYIPNYERAIDIGHVELTWMEAFDEDSMLPVIVQRVNRRYKLAGGKSRLLCIDIEKNGAGLCLLKIKRDEMEIHDDIPF